LSMPIELDAMSRVRTNEEVDETKKIDTSTSNR
jgi:hypothetical protein